MNPTRTIALFASAALAAAAHADTISQTVDYTYDINQPGLTPVAFDGFDSSLGTLTDVSVTFDGELSMTVFAENFDTTPYDAGTWSLEASHTVLLSLGAAPLVGLGGQSDAGITGFLAAGMGGGPFGGIPGEPHVSSQTIDHMFTRAYDSSNFGAFIDAGTMSGTVGPFTDLFLIPPPGAGFIGTGFDVLSQDGSLTLQYTFDPIPAPGVGAVAALGALTMTRRRRS